MPVWKFAAKGQSRTYVHKERSLTYSDMTDTGTIHVETA
jgi:hypothetical protein